MVRFLAVLLAASALCGAAQAKDQYRLFRNVVDRGSLQPFTRDLGGILGAATFHSGRSLGFSGFDLGVHGGVQLRPEAGDRVLRSAGIEAFGLPWVQAEIGMPFRLDGYIRGGSFQGLSIAGGGLRYGLSKESENPWKPQFLISGVGHSVTHRDFTASHFGLNLVASLGFRKLTPYAGVGMDRTRVVVRDAVLDPTLIGSEAIAEEMRYTAGASLRAFSFLYLQGAYTLAHGQSGFDSGLGVRF